MHQWTAMPADTQTLHGKACMQVLPIGKVLLFSGQCCVCFLFVLQARCALCVLMASPDQPAEVPAFGYSLAPQLTRQ